MAVSDQVIPLPTSSIAVGDWAHAFRRAREPAEADLAARGRHRSALVVIRILTPPCRRGLGPWWQRSLTRPPPVLSPCPSPAARAGPRRSHRSARRSVPGRTSHPRARSGAGEGPLPSCRKPLPRPLWVCIFTIGWRRTSVHREAAGVLSPSPAKWHGRTGHGSRGRTCAIRFSGVFSVSRPHRQQLSTSFTRPDRPARTLPIPG